MARFPLSIVKIGGKSAENNELISALADELRTLQDRSHRILLIHGGGITISEIQDKYGIKPRFVDGLRQTAPAEMPMVDMALAGAVNKRLVRLLRTRDLNAWGLCGADAGILKAESVTGSAEKNRTGKVGSLNTRPFEILWDNGYTPVFAPPATDSLGRGININADEAALSLSAAFKADQLIFISDVPGVLDDSRIIRHLTPEIAEEKIESGVISGGMIPKVRSAVGALDKGVGAVFIGNYSNPGDLEGILSGKLGTLINSGGLK